MPKIRYINRLEQIPQLSRQERKLLNPVVKYFAFRTNDYYQSLIDWNDPHDPIHRIVVPDIFELLAWGELDASKEGDYSVAPSLQHKYRDTALLLANNTCGAYCRFCFRKRLFMNDNDEVERDFTEAFNYIREHNEINSVLISGGDPLILSNRRLERIIQPLHEIDHVQIIRIGSKMTAFNPFRITEDPGLVQMLSNYSADEKKIHVVCHFNHPRELTAEAIKSLNMLMKAGVVVLNQTPLLGGINDDPTVLAQLFNKLAGIGAPPYYVFQCRPTAGNSTYSVPIEQAIDVFDFAKNGCSGLARRARFTMSHATGKVEILGKDSDRVYFKYHRVVNPRYEGKFFSCRRNPNAHWLDDYEDFASGEVEESLSLAEAK